jgi:hypothetical protein
MMDARIVAVINTVMRYLDALDNALFIFFCLGFLVVNIRKGI